MRMTKQSFSNLLLGNDLRTVRQNATVVRTVKDQDSFDDLFVLVFHHQRPVVIRAVDAVEKVTIDHPEYLQPHKAQLMSVLKSADHKELKWHIAQLMPRLRLSEDELREVRNIFAYWALNKYESKIVRVNALQGLFDLSLKHPDVKNDVLMAISAMEHDRIPSIQARIRRLRKSLE